MKTHALAPLCAAVMLALAGCATSQNPAQTTPQAPSDASQAPPTNDKAEKKPLAEETRPLYTPPPPPEPSQPLSRGKSLASIEVMAERAPSSAPLMAPASPAQGYVAMQMMPMAGDIDRENYTHFKDNGVQQVAEQPVSTFGLDVDTGAYTNVRRMLASGNLPPADAVRAEEFINYFDYGYTPPSTRAEPFSVTTELAPEPWNTKRELLMVGIQGYRVPGADVPPANLVFLVDTSGSMDEPAKLPLLKASLRQLVPRLRAQDHVSLVTYAGEAGVALESTPGNQHAKILAAIDALGAGGSTNGGAGIDMAYAQAKQGFIKGGVNRIVLATDGDFNVGTTGIEALKTRITEERKGGVALSTLGFGQGNYNDAMAMQLADTGNGNHHYIDSLAEARKVLVDEMSSTMMTIAKDVKIQVEFNPAVVKEYRLIGYEKRALAREDFNNDAVDAGEIGAGANVTALYEVTLVGEGGGRVDPLRYGPARPVANDRAAHGELAFLRIRYKAPDGNTSKLIERPLSASVAAAPSERLRFAASVAAFADALRGGKYIDGWDYAKIAALANGARGSDDMGYRAGFVQMVRSAGGLSTTASGGGTDGNDATVLR